MSAVPPPPQRMRGFTFGRFHYLQRMIWVAGWMSQASVDGLLEQLVGLFNTVNREALGDARLKYTRTKMPVPGNVLYKRVHAGDDPAYTLLESRVRWADDAQVSKGDAVVFFTFLRGTFIWPRVGVWALQCLAVYMLLMQIISRGWELLVRGVVLLPCALLSHPPLSRLTIRVTSPDIVSASS